MLSCPKKGAAFASPIPCHLPPALFGLSFPVLLICCLLETRLFHTFCLISVLSPGRKAPLTTSATFSSQVSLAAAAQHCVPRDRGHTSRDKGGWCPLLIPWALNQQ